MVRQQKPALGYLRTSSATNVGPDKDSDKRQREAIEGYAKAAGYLIAADSPDSFKDNTPTATLIRQILGSVAEFYKAMTVAKLKAARDRKIAQGLKCGGRQSHAEARPDVVALAKALSKQRTPILSLRQIAGELERQGYVNANSKAYAAASIKSMIES